MYERVIGISRHMEQNKILDSIKRGFLICIPVLMIGLVINILQDLPIAALQNWYASDGIGGEVNLFFDALYDMTIGMIGVYVGVAVSYIHSSKFENESRYISATAVVSALISIFLSLGIAHTGFELERYGASAVFIGFFVAILSVSLFYWVLGYMKERIGITFDGSIRSRVASIYWLAIPFFVCIFVFFAINEIIYAILDVVCISDAISAGLVIAFTKLGPNYFSGILMMLLEGILWFFGIHGGSLVEPVQMAIFGPCDTDPSVIISRAFMDTYGLVGGCGATLCLFFAILIWDRRKEQRLILRTAAVPIIFNVSEPLVFGVPIIFNLILLVPFLLTPVLGITIAYIATAIGFLPVIDHSVSWLVPTFLSGYMASGSWRGVFIQLIIVVLGTLLYAPFVKMQSKSEIENTAISAKPLEDYYKQHMDDEEPVHFLHRHDSWSIVASSIVSDLRYDIQRGHIPMRYQPQIDGDGHVYGAEALLRWKYGDMEMFPPFVIRLADEAGLSNALGRAIVHRVITDTASLRQKGKTDLCISVNVSGDQLNDVAFIDEIIVEARKYGVTSQLCIEVTEEVDIANMYHVTSNIEHLIAAQIKVSMDDFSTGTTSVKSLKLNQFSHIKLDGSLVRDMEENARSREIVASMINLGKNMGFSVVAEYVDTEKKLDDLREMGCDYFQGYYYSPAIELSEFEQFIEETEKKHS